MAHNVLITRASRYLGGTLCSRWHDAKLPNYGKLFALVRNEEQAQSVRQLYRAEPLIFSPENEAEVHKAIVENRITIVLFLIGAYYATSQVNFIKALSKVKETTGAEVHFVYTSGTKQFSSLSGTPSTLPLLDTDPGLYEKHKAQRTPLEEFQQSATTNITIIDKGEECGVRTYIFSPCMVYGRGEGFGNKLSIQTVDIVSAAKATGKVYKFSDEKTYWPVCHLSDTTNLYLQMLRAMLTGRDIGYGKQGFYLASSGLIAWDDVYSGIASSLARRGTTSTPDVSMVDDEALVKMAEATGVDKVSVAAKISGNSLYTAEHGKEIGWTPQFPPAHLLEVLDDEVGFILENLSEHHRGLR